MNQRGRRGARRGGAGRGNYRQNRNPFCCWSCGKEGHIAKDCPERKHNLAWLGQGWQAKCYQENDQDKTNGDLLNLQDLLSMDDVKPEVRLLVNGKFITFLCDTGACRTTCREGVPQAKTNGNVVVVRSASGKLTEVEESEPVWL